MRSFGRVSRRCEIDTEKDLINFSCVNSRTKISLYMDPKRHYIFRRDSEMKSARHNMNPSHFRFSLTFLRPILCNFVPSSPQAKILYAFLSTNSTWLSICSCSVSLNPYPTAFPYGNGMVLHFYQQQESSTTKTVHKVINKGLKTYV